MLDGGKVGGELVCRATAECCLTGAGAGAGVGEGGLVIEWMSLAGLGAVGGGTGLGDTGGGIFFPSPTETERKRGIINRHPYPKVFSVLRNKEAQHNKRTDRLTCLALIQGVNMVQIK